LANAANILPSIISNKQNTPQSNNSTGQVDPRVDEGGIVAGTLVQGQETTNTVTTILGCD
jgi:hypothetical protein